jgi:hypothetical protein
MPAIAADDRAIDGVKALEIVIGRLCDAVSHNRFWLLRRVYGITNFAEFLFHALG